MATPEELARLVQDAQTAAVVRLEDEVAAQAVGETDEQFTALVQRTLAAWVAATGAVGAAAISAEALRRLLATVRAAIRRLLDGLAPRSRRALEGALAEAVTLGARQHAAFVGEASGRRAAAPPPRPSRALRDTAARVVDVVTERRDRALAMLRPNRARRWSDILTGIGTARGALSAVRSHISWAIGQAVNESVLVGIGAMAARKLWVAEADACVRCAAYAGLVVDADADFPAGLSWDPAQRGRGEPVTGPPLHANCRCRIVAWRDAWAEAVPLPEWLRSEAMRSVAFGQARPSESRAARIRAATALLASGQPLPPATRRAAQAAVRNGRFPQTATG